MEKITKEELLAELKLDGISIDDLAKVSGGNVTPCPVGVDIEEYKFCMKRCLLSGFEYEECLDRC